MFPSTPRLAGSLRSLGLAGTWALALGCAHLHHYQVADIDGSQGTLEPFEVQVDETGFDLQEASEAAKLVSDSNQHKRLDEIQGFLALFQYGPTTGDPTFSDDWADGLTAQILARCPSGQVTGLVALRESADYPVVSGQVVTIRGYCVR